MTARLRVLVLLARPALVFAMALFALAGIAAGGAADDSLLAVRSLVVAVAFLVCLVAVNDLSDVAVDRVNLPGDPRRPFASGIGTFADGVVVAVGSGVVALGAAALAGLAAFVVVLAGLALGVAYSVPPLRLSARGFAGPLVVPFGFVAVPFLVGLLGAAGDVTARDLVLLGGLYAGFLGRILLKDFRDVRGDTLLGKRTFVVRHGRRVTCAVSAAFCVVGIGALVAVRDRTPEVVAAYAGAVVVLLVLLRALSRDEGPRRDERLVSAIAIAGRCAVLALVLHLAARDAGWPRLPYAALLVGLVAVTAGQVRVMVRYGPRRGAGVPAEWTARESVLG